MNRPPDVELDDCREVLDAPGTSPDDEPTIRVCAALRPRANGLDIIVTVIRRDGRWAQLCNDADFVYAHSLDEPP